MKPRLWHATSVLMVLCSCGSDSTTDLGTDAGPTTDSNGTPSPDSIQEGSPSGDAEHDSSNQSVDGGDSARRDGGTGRDASGSSDSGMPGTQRDASRPPVSRRLPLPCVAPLPTGFCLQSDPGDFIGNGHNYVNGGPGSVAIRSSGTSTITLHIVTGTDAGNSLSWDVDFASPGNFPSSSNPPLVPGLYDPAERYPFETGNFAGLDIFGNGVGCNTVTGKFSIEELARDPVSGITRFSATFEHHCEGGTPAIRGVLNYQASGSPDPTPVPDRVINLSGKIVRVAYDASSNVAYGLDATNRRLAKIDLTSGSATYADVVQVPNDGCVDVKRGSLFVVNKGSSLITEYGTGDLKPIRDINWAGIDSAPTDTSFEIHCAPDKLYVVDGANAPGLFTVENLDSATPVVTDRTAQVSGVGSLVVTAAATNLYYWYQLGWSAGSLATSVRRVLVSDLSQIDQSSANVPSFNRNPLDAPILLDEMRELIFSKNKIFDATNLAKVVYTLPSAFDTFNGAAENAYALDSARGFLASKNFVYALDRYDIVAPTIMSSADQMFFDASGVLWYLSVSQGALAGQFVGP